MGEKVPLLARAVGGKVLGPRPGRAIISFWQGIVEIVLRAVALVSALCAVVPAAVALTKLQGVNADVVNEKGEHLIPVGRGGSGVVLAVAVIGLVLEILFITLRFLNIGIINYKIRIVLFVDFGVTIGVAVGLLLASIIAAYASQQWASISEAIHISLAASAAIGVLAVGVFSLLAVWLLLFALYKWNRSVVTYTLKDAIIG